MKKLNRIDFILLSVITTVFFSTLTFGFIAMDDNRHFYNNVYFHPPTLSSLITFWQASYFGMYIPVIYTVWWLIATISTILSSGIEPLYFHLLNVCLHTFNAYLLFTLLKKIFINTPPLTLLMVVLVFALHPVQVETIAWASGAKDLLTASFVLLYLHLALTPQRQGLLFLTYFGAILTKPTAIVLPLVHLALYYVWPQRWKKPKTGFLTFSSLVALIVTASTTKLQNPQIIPLSLRDKLIVAGDALQFYIQKLFFPWPLLPDYGRTPEFVLQQSTWPILSIIFIGACAYFIFKKQKQVLWLLCCSLLFILPVLGFIPFEFQNMSTVADRYLYLPSLFLSMLFCQVAISKKWFQPILIALVLVFTPLTLWQQWRWQNNKTLFSHVVTYNQKSFTAWNNLGFQAFKESQWQKAEGFFKNAFALKPEYLPAASNLGATLLQQNKALEAIAILMQTKTRTQNSIRPGDAAWADLHFNLGLALTNVHRRIEAKAAFEECLRHNPQHPKAQRWLASTPN